MRAKTQIALLIGLAGLAIGLLFSSNLNAQAQPFNLITSPLPINLTTTPGKPVSAELKVKNNSTQDEELKVSLYKFSVNENSEVSLQEKEQGDDFLDWVSFTPSVFTAEPNQWKTVKMSVDVPQDAALGYYYAVGFSRADEPQPSPSGAALKGQVITFVLLDVQVPGAKRELTITEFSADRSTYEFLPATFMVKVKNTGNIHVVPAGTVFIKRGGQTVATLNLNPGQGNILPNSSRTFSVEWADGFPMYIPKVDNGQPVSNPDSTTAKTLKWDFSQVPDLRVGKYSAKLVLVYDDGTRDVPIEGNLGFWVMPWRLLAGLLIVLLLVGVGLWAIGKKAFGTGKRLRKRSKKE